MITLSTLIDNTSWRLENKFSIAVPDSPEIAGEHVLIRLQTEQQKAQQREQLAESLKVLLQYPLCCTMHVHNFAMR